MVFLTNNFTWSATTIAELYKARWEVELLFNLNSAVQLARNFETAENAEERKDLMSYERGNCKTCQHGRAGRASLPKRA